MGVSRVAKVEFPYGFRGEVYSIGDVGHEIYYGPGAEANELVVIGEYLQRIGYFGPSYMEALFSLRVKGEGWRCL